MSQSGKNDDKLGTDRKSYRDDYDMLGQVIAGNPHLKRIVLDKLRIMKQSFSETAFEKANRQQKEVQNANKAKAGGQK